MYLNLMYLIENKIIIFCKINKFIIFGGIKKINRRIEIIFRKRINSFYYIFSEKIKNEYN